MYKDLREFIEDIDVRDGESIRTSCPMCGGKNTFTVTRDDAAVVYNCYKNSCDVSGRMRKGRSVSSIRERVFNRVSFDAPPPELELDKTAFTVPAGNVSCNKYLDSMNVRPAIQDGYANIMYDIAEHRCVFMIPDTRGNTIGAVGRALTKGVVPKWKRYDKCKDLLYFCGPREGTAVLVEDCASACTVYASGGVTGVALLGTNLSDSQVAQLRVFDKVRVALDADASRKALKLQRIISPYVNTDVVLLTEDLKYYTPSAVKSLLTS